MTKDEGILNDESQSLQRGSCCSSVRHSFDIRHSSFVIRFTPLSCVAADAWLNAQSFSVHRRLVQGSFAKRKPDRSL
jgi:hypothetical protein